MQALEVGRADRHREAADLALMKGSLFRERAQARIRLYLDPRKRPESPTLRVVPYRGARFLVWANEDVGWRLCSERSYEPAELDILRERIQPSDICLDVGANIGIFTVFMARWASSGHVHAFEPIEHSASALRLNLELNGIRNATVHTLALGDRDGECRFSVAEDGAYSSLVHTARKTELEIATVRMQTLESLIASLERPPDVIKIDVEGAELVVLRSGIATLRDAERRPRLVMAEAHEPTSRPYGYGPSDLVSFMAGAGYRAKAILPDGGLLDWPARRALPDILFVAS